MIKNTTQQELLLYAYNETNLCDSERIQRAIDSDPLLQHEYDEIFSIIELLSISPEVSPDSVKRILEFC